jgi:hypothetical protein
MYMANTIMHRCCGMITLPDQNLTKDCWPQIKKKYIGYLYRIDLHC